MWDGMDKTQLSTFCAKTFKNLNFAIADDVADAGDDLGDHNDEDHYNNLVTIVIIIFIFNYQVLYALLCADNIVDANVIIMMMIIMITWSPLS